MSTTSLPEIAACELHSWAYDLVITDAWISCSKNVITLDPNVLEYVEDRVEVLVPDKVLARKVIADILSTTKFVIRDMRDTVLAMVQVLPKRLPVEIFLRNIGESTIST